MKTLKKFYILKIRSSSIGFVFFVIASAFFIFSGCEKNEAPTCSITAPTNSSSYEYGQAINISIKASDHEGGLQRIELFVDNNKVTETTDAYLDYTLSTDNFSVGEHEIEAVATDVEGANGKDKIVIDIKPLVLSPPEGMTIYAKVEAIDLYWYAYDAKSYNIFWTDNGADPTINSNKISIQDDSYTHTNLDPAKTYSYRIQSVNGEFTSNLSEMVSASPKQPPLPPPENVKATAGTSTITVNWDAVNTQGLTYSVERKSGWYFSKIADGLTATEYIDNDIEPGKGYTYKIIAHDAATSRTSEDSETAYAVTSKTIYETERNNQNVSSTLGYTTHYYSAEDITYDLDKYRIKGSYSGSYSIYSAASYKDFDADCFQLDLENGDIVEFKLISGNMSDLWSMKVGLNIYQKYTSGSYSDGEIYSFSAPSDACTFSYTGSGTLIGVYLDISMWEDLVNYGPYNYEIEITIIRAD